MFNLSTKNSTDLRLIFDEHRFHTC